MSLGVSPSSLSASQRPLPPSRANRHSLLARSDIHRDNAGAEDASNFTLQDLHSQTAGVMGGLRERTEEELKRASREAIEEALREEWEVRDRVGGLERTPGSLICRPE